MIKKIILIASALMLSMSSVYADCDISVKNSVVTLKASDFKGYNDVMIRVFRNGKTADDLLSCENMLDVIAYQEQKQTDRSGNAEFIFSLDRTDTYTVEIGELDRTETTQYTFEYADANYSKNVIEQINQAISGKNAQLVKDYIDANYEKLSLEAKLYEEKLDEGADVSVVFGLIANGEAIASSDELSKKLNTCVLLEELKTAEDKIKLIKDNAQITVLGENTAYKVFDEYASQSAKEEIISTINQGAYTSADEAISAFEMLSLTSGIKNALGAQTVKGILTLCSEDLQIDLQKTESLKNPSSVYLALAGRSFDTSEAVAAAYENAYLTQKREEENVGSGSSSGGGGGGSSSSGYSGPIASVTDTNMPFESTLFNDLNNYEWAKDSIEALCKKGIVSGKGDGVFDPGGYVTREEFAKLVTMAAEVYYEDAWCGFDDVPSGSWYYSYVASGVKSGIINGINDKVFGTGRRITREDMAVMIYRAMEGKIEKSDVSIPDEADIADYAKGPVKCMYGAGILSGMDDGSFAAKKPANRAEAAVIIDRMINFLEGV